MIIRLWRRIDNDDDFKVMNVLMMTSYCLIVLYPFVCVLYDDDNKHILTSNQSLYCIINLQHRESGDLITKSNLINNLTHLDRDKVTTRFFPRDPINN